MSRNSERKLENLYNEYSGERIFIIGNGPSLSKTQLSRLGSEYTFALNKINAMYDAVSWRPSFYLFMKSTMDDEEEKFVEENIDNGSVCFLNENYRSIFGNKKHIYYIKRKKLAADPLTVADISVSHVDNVDLDELSDVWGSNITKGVYKQHSMYPILQIVSYLGFDEVYLLGCDLGFDVQKPYLLFESGVDPAKFISKKKFFRSSLRDRTPVRSIVNAVLFKLMLTRPVGHLLRRVTTLYEDRSHFTESYDGKIRFRDVNEEISNAHRVAKRVLNAEGVTVYNATPGGELEVYPRVDFDTIVNGS